MKWIVFSKDNIDIYMNFLNNHTHSGIWHTPDWLDFQIVVKKAKTGFFFGISKDDKLILAGLYLVQESKTVNFGYIPAGFLYNEIDDGIYNFFLLNLNAAAKKENILFTQIDSITPFDDKLENIIDKYKNIKKEQKLPIPQFTNIIDLNSDEEDILSKMKHKGRYNIKLAEKKGIKVKVGNISDIPVFYKILTETTKRDGFRPNYEDYYGMMIKIIKNPLLLIAYHEDDILAAGIFTYTKFQGLYYYGASSNIKRNLMAPYLLQWEAIKIAKSKKCSYFDFMGIANPDDPKDRLIGVTDFKLKFSENIVKFNSSYHVIHNKFKYIFFNMAKKIKKLIKKT